jgi:hypothetical protein
LALSREVKTQRNRILCVSNVMGPSRGLMPALWPQWVVVALK